MGQHAYLYRMPSMSDNNHLKLALHLTNCQSSVTIQADSLNMNLQQFLVIKSTFKILFTASYELGLKP